MCPDGHGLTSTNLAPRGGRPQLKRDPLGRERPIPTPTWLRTGTGFPLGGIELAVTYRTGSHSSYLHLPLLNPILSGLFGRDLYEGSVNFHADAPVRFPAPATSVLGGAEWLFAPVIMAESAVGVAARKADSGDIPFIEVFAPDNLAPKLGLTPERRLVIRLLSGEYLGLAA